MRLIKVAALGRQLGPADSRSAPPQRQRTVKPNEPGEQLGGEPDPVRELPDQPRLAEIERAGQLADAASAMARLQEAHRLIHRFELPPALGPAGPERPLGNARADRAP